MGRLLIVAMTGKAVGARVGFGGGNRFGAEAGVGAEG